MTLYPDIAVTGPGAARPRAQGSAPGSAGAGEFVSGTSGRPISDTSGASISGTSGATTRDPRLDVFRGMGMFIILIAHVPGNFWGLWIPARFGFSDAAEIFVFCSGMASAIAFGRVFDKMGWGIGTARVAYRVWQIYWAHIGLFMAVAFTVSALNSSGYFDKDYVSGLNIQWFFDDVRPGRDTTSQLLGLMTLTYVPNYFDILPMYIVILVMMPFVMLLHRISPWLLLAVLSALWLSTQLGDRDLDGIWWADSFGLPGFPAEPWTDRPWFFNPFGWQIVFYTGFALMRGWIPAPPVRWWLVALAAGYVLLTVPVAWHEIRNDSEWLKEIWATISPLRAKTEEGILRYLHILSLAYLAYVAAGDGGHRLIATGTTAAARIKRGVVGVFTLVGQQSLAIFLWAMWMSRIMGVMIDELGNDTATVGLINLFGIFSVWAVAWTCAWFKSQPWKPRRPVP